ncbi:hypothetical protein O181_091081 [Austropuccinia psidii MF-1]|uniref:Uncharacterized protein n=1 Tax=Austropuccinia psidii MF-1 TaxID=1389203 RepID=A0A9Q3IWQ6_9BASI|nr:hypothetical protein [Austropuccinia psidii MF-1]
MDRPKLSSADLARPLSLNLRVVGVSRFEWIDYKADGGNIVARFYSISKRWWVRNSSKAIEAVEANSSTVSVDDHQTAISRSSRNSRNSSGRSARLARSARSLKSWDNLTSPAQPHGADWGLTRYGDLPKMRAIITILISYGAS